ncbi:MAG: FAD:protein FMN transferase [Bacteroidota bacterium]|jgi:thiamine biosynthesis lipoprotein|nr:FAD:protein FMN transferase [Bacteroidota bacterium]
MFRRPSLALTLFLVAVFAVALLLALLMNREEEPPVARTQIAMGTMIEIQVRGLSRDRADAAITAAFAEVRRVDMLFSTYKTHGPVWRLNHSRDTIIQVPDEVHALLRRCDTLWRASGGAFDAAIEPLVRAWGFDGETPAVPSAEALAAARAHSGWAHVSIADHRQIRKKPDAAVNFGAIAKGYAVDRAVAVLMRHGAHDALVNAGGEIRATGGDWQVGIQHPRSPSEMLAVVELHGRAIATSGDYEQYFVVDGSRYHHIFDPATGRPATRCQSVSVIADDDMTADAMATAVFVMGPERGMDFLTHSPDIEALIVDADGMQHSTPGFARYRMR